jgi:nucleoside 2-deoxyribosyltransferase
MRVYIAGPITGIPDHNFPAFRAAAKDLRRLGISVISPIEINGESEGKAGNWQQCMKADIAALTQCDMVALLPGWQNSRGALLEQYVALNLGIPCQPIQHFLTAASRPLVSLKEATHHE